jgi:hypothetical protein
MPPSASQDIAPPAKAAWLAGPARSLRKLIGQGVGEPSGRDWIASPSARSKSRRPVWE